MTVPAIGSPVRIGLVGLGRLGVHHLERMSLRSDLQIVAACNGGAEVGGAHPLCRNVLSRMEDLLARDDLDYILIAAPQNVTAVWRSARLRREKMSPSSRRRASTATKHGPCWRPPAARAAPMRAPQPARGIRLSRCPSDSPGRPPGDDRGRTNRLVGQGCPARLAGSGRQPRTAGNRSGRRSVRLFRVSVRRPIVAIGPSAGKICLRTDSQSAGVRSDRGGVFSVDRIPRRRRRADRRQPPQRRALHTGWMLAGTSGAYCQQRIYVADPSGEICDVPVAPADVPTIDPHAALLHPARSDEDRLDSARDAAMVMRVVDAARESSRSGEAVRLDETNRHSM